ncbi:YoaK family protein [Saccharopolyspora rosea]|uniref:YoaK family protein n=1 Tax=Saccharopolyspora rosea TaxID=524884 RepID=A0ABW3FUP4_9PSEU|nr:YoaK family protein [Saccharopolyspora rosea]
MPGSRRLPLGTLAVVLTFGTGAVDVISFTRLGEVFSSVMTGNLVLLGLAVARVSAPLAVHTALAFAGYIAGAAVGSRITGPPRPRGRVWPPRVTAVLVVEAAVIAAFTGGWVVTDAHPDGAWQLALLGLASLGMGLQSAAMRGLGGRTKVSTTYLTGMLTGVVAGLVAPGRSEFDVRATTILAAAAAGAAAGGGLLLVAPRLVPVLPLAALAVVIAAAALHRAE